MKTAITILAILFLVGGLLAYQASKEDSDTSSSQDQTTDQSQQQTQAQINKENCVSDECLQVDNLEYPAGELPANVQESLVKALDDEYKAYATYDAVISKLGKIRPFSMIIRAEEQHISSLKALFDKYGLDIPGNSYIDSVSIANTKAENCSVGVAAEIANADLYRNELLPTVSEYPDIISVFTNLMNASQDNHLPAFQK
ncbi:hypothetical protein KC959_04240, partial [Candidatus Saccharibacteria bacterium]|nr:hypothetical protein [Candidatus Saccharibacteria bacterium]